MDPKTIENIKREAYLKAIKFKNTGLDEEAIYARLEKQGVPYEIAIEVAKNVVLQKEKDIEKNTPVFLTTYTIWSRILNIFFPKSKS